MKPASNRVRAPRRGAARRQQRFQGPGGEGLEAVFGGRRCTGRERLQCFAVAIGSIAPRHARGDDLELMLEVEGYEVGDAAHRLDKHAPAMPPEELSPLPRLGADVRPIAKTDRCNSWAWQREPLHSICGPRPSCASQSLMLAWSCLRGRTCGCPDSAWRSGSSVGPWTRHGGRMLSFVWRSAGSESPFQGTPQCRAGRSWESLQFRSAGRQSCGG